MFQDAVLGFVEGQLVAHAFVEFGRDADITFVCVSKQHQRCGYGVVLMKKVLSIARERGCGSASLECVPLLVPFYALCGFREASPIGVVEQDEVRLVQKLE